MNTDIDTSGQTTAPEKPVVQRVPINILPSGVEALKRFKREMATYRRELPRLLDEGEVGRHVLIKGDDLLSVWDTQADAVQPGCERFGLEPFYVKQIDPRDGERFALLDAWQEAQCRSSQM
jgi:hypothetical protein